MNLCKNKVERCYFSVVNSDDDGLRPLELQASGGSLLADDAAVLVLLQSFTLEATTSAGDLAVVGRGTGGGGSR